MSGDEPAIDAGWSGERWSGLVWPVPMVLACPSPSRVRGIGAMDWVFEIPAARCPLMSWPSIGEAVTAGLVRSGR